MKINMHDRTPTPEIGKALKTLFIFALCLAYSIFALLGFCVIYYAHHIVGGLFVLILPFILAVPVTISILDMQRSYIEIIGNQIHVVNYHFLRKNTTEYNLKDIAIIKQLLSSSFRLSGPRYPITGVSYLAFYNTKGHYLFKIMATPEALTFVESLLGSNSHITYQKAVVI